MASQESLPEDAAMDVGLEWSRHEDVPGLRSALIASKWEELHRSDAAVKADGSMRCDDGLSGKKRIEIDLTGDRAQNRRKISGGKAKASGEIEKSSNKQESIFNNLFNKTL